MSTERLEAFSDGVFAIAATLLVINVDAQVRGGSTDLAAALLSAWPSYLAYALSFVTIGIIWVNHHTIMTLIDRVDRIFLFLTIGFLMCVAFIPFPTRLLAEHVRDEAARAAAIVYGVNLTATAVLFTSVWLYASGRRRLLRQDADPRTVSGITRSFRPGAFFYLAATLCALLDATLSVVLYVGIALFYVIESSFFGRH
jgi:TMEM175 potassium channel family protein